MSIVLHSVSIRHVVAYKRHMQLRNSKTLTPKKWSQLQTTRVRACDVVWLLDTATVNESWRFEMFPCTSSSFLCAGTLSLRGKCC